MTAHPTDFHPHLVYDNHMPGSSMDGLEVVARDITEQRIDSVVNAANNSLLGGGGADGAIHRAAGPELLQECRLLAGCATGNARITSGYNLPARWVLHTVGPVWKGGGHRERDLPASCYRRCLELRRSALFALSHFRPSAPERMGFPCNRQPA